MLDEAARLLDDPIVAVATGESRTAIGVIRLSGPADRIDAVLGRCVRLHSPYPLVAGRVRRFDLLDPTTGEEIDEGLLLRFEAPRSYTGEDVVELSLHGNPVLLELGLQALQSAGARAAGPGEFTRRAVIHGKLNLLEAEAVALTIEAESRAAARLARRHLGGELTSRIEQWKQQVLVAAAGLEALIDFPEEIEEDELTDSVGALGACRLAMSQLADSYSAGRSLVRGLCVVILGPVNAGKSTLFNALLDYDRAIVSPLAGTTRDLIGEAVEWAGLSLRIEDTAGLRSTVDPLELAGISRSEQAASRADLSIEVRDGREVDLADSLLITQQDCVATLWVATHGDLIDPDEKAALRTAGWIVVQPNSAEAVESVRLAVGAALSSSDSHDGLMIHSARQHQALLAATASLSDAVDHGLDEPVLAAFALRAANDSLEEFLGRWDSEEVLDVLFEHFCIGK
jgi:tRNA modification GTPase